MLLPTALVLAAAAPAGAPAAGAGGLSDILQSPFLLFGVLGLLMYFMIFRPQQQRQRQHRDMIGAIKRGDTVVLSSGVIGKVVRVEEAEVGVEIAQNVNIKVVKSMITEVRVRGEPVAANDSKK
ncbi:MAG TPA: preprotein translocase subunit YajC [Caulobacteraceae bacterium]|jgi:preprotein translocase subunit YajC